MPFVTSHSRCSAISSEPQISRPNSISALRVGVATSSSASELVLFCVAIFVPLRILALYINLGFRLFGQPCTGQVDGNPIQSSLCGEVQRLMVFPAPCEIVRMLRSYNRSKVLAFRRNNPKAVWPGEI